MVMSSEGYWILRLNVKGGIKSLLAFRKLGGVCIYGSCAKDRRCALLIQMD